MFLAFEVPALCQIWLRASNRFKSYLGNIHKQHDLIGLLAVFMNSFNYEVTKDFRKKSIRLRKIFQVFVLHWLILITKTTYLIPSSPLLPYCIALLTLHCVKQYH